MNVKVSVKLQSTKGVRKKLGSVKVGFTRAGLALLLVAVLLWWRGFGYERVLWRSWFESGEDDEDMRRWTWGQVSLDTFPSCCLHFWLEGHFLAQATSDTRPDHALGRSNMAPMLRTI